MGGSKTSDSGSSTGGGKPASVSVAIAGPKVIVETIPTVGNVESPFKVEVSPKIAGRINFLQAREGDTVKAGEVLLKVDPGDLEGAVVQQEANVAEAKSRLAQAQLTSGANNVGISSQIQQQEAALAGAKADLDQVEKNFAAQVEAAQTQVDAADEGVRGAEASVEKEQATLQNVQSRYQRTLTLYSKGFTAAQDLDDAQTAVGVQQGAVGVAEHQLASAKSVLAGQKQNLLITQRKGQSDISASKARLAQAQAALDVATANRSQSPAYRRNLDALRSTVDAAEAQLNQAKSRVQDTVIQSSISGTVTARKADPGALATPGTPVLEVQFLDWVYVTGSIPIDREDRIHEGQPARIEIDALPGKSFVGKIANINPAADTASRQFGVKVRLENLSRMVRPGMYGHITIETGRVDAPVVVPHEALIRSQEDGSMTVVVARPDDTAEIRPVTLGASDDRETQIFSGVKAGERVVVLSYTQLKTGQKLAVAMKKQDLLK